MFSTFAPPMRERGWRALIPLYPGEKRPVFSRWQMFCKTPPTDRQIAGWTRCHAGDGIGLAFGPDNVLGADLDWLEPELADKAWEITRGILGTTPLIRVGLPPKRLALYRCEPGFTVKRAYGSFELFSQTGQCVMFGIHPDTGQPYHWLDETPATVGPMDLPLAGNRQVHALVDALEALDPGATARHRAKTNAANAAHQPGFTAGMLRALQGVEDAPAEAAKILAAAPPGRRHNTMVGAVMALAMRGYSDPAIFAAIDGPYNRVMDDLTWEAAEVEVRNAIKWARDRHGPDDETVARELPPALITMATSWNRRWGR